METRKVPLALLCVATGLILVLALPGCWPDMGSEKPTGPAVVDSQSRPEPNIADGIRVDGTEFTKVDMPDGSVRYEPTGYRYLEAQINGEWVIVGTTENPEVAQQEADRRRQKK